MNTGQMMLVLGALMLLSAVTLGVNRMLVTKTTTMLEAEASLVGVSLAQSMLDEIQTKSYDAATAGGTRIWDSTLFTPSGGLGRSALESSNVPLPESPDTVSAYKSVKYYNDVDDYNRYKRYSFHPSLGTFTILDTVLYVQEANPDLMSTPQTFYKKIVVTVTHPNMKYPLQLSDLAIYRRYF